MVQISSVSRVRSNQVQIAILRSTKQCVVRKEPGQKPALLLAGDEVGCSNLDKSEHEEGRSNEEYGL